MTQRKLGSGIFTPQVGLRLVPRAAVAQVLTPVHSSSLSSPWLSHREPSLSTSACDVPDFPSAPLSVHLRHHRFAEDSCPDLHHPCPPQLWKAVGLVPKQLEPTPVQCAALTSPKSASGSARPPLPPPFSSGGGRRLMSGSTFSGELSFGSVSSTGCVSIHMASCDINPKSLKVRGGLGVSVLAPLLVLPMLTAAALM